MNVRHDLGSEGMKAARTYVSRHRSARQRFSRGEAALLVIDMQRYFLDRSSHAFLSDAERIIGNVQTLIGSCREHSVPVVFTRHAYGPRDNPGAMGRWWGDVIRDGTEMSLLDSRLAPLPSEKIIRKTKYSAFAGTALESWLRAHGVSQVLITGVMTHLCCESTAREAFMKDFDVFLVVDGTASSTSDLHLSSVKTLTDGFAMPATTKEVLRWMRR